MSGWLRAGVAGETRGGAITAPVRSSPRRYIELNERDPGDPSYGKPWTTVPMLQAKGALVLGSLGGGSVGDYTNLFANPGACSTFYALLRDALRAHHLDGIDLDIEESDARVDTTNVRKLVADLRRDFDDRRGGFVITSAPVATALLDKRASASPNVDYVQLIDQFDLYLLQFYNGFGDLALGTHRYQDIIKARGVSSARKLVAGVLTSPTVGATEPEPEPEQSVSHAQR